jgi:hypothetical protein
MQDYLRRTLYSPRWQFLRRFLEPYVLSGNEHNQWLRIVMNRETRKLVESLGPSRLKVLEISGNYWSQPGLFQQYRTADYPEFDICASPLDDSFDLIIAEQVFEHVLWPYRAGKNVYQMLSLGGAFLVSTPFLLKIHAHPFDCTRWTEMGLKHFLAECGFPLEQIQTGSWGNRSCVKANLNGRWQIFQPWRHSLHNEADCPLVVWALARK